MKKYLIVIENTKSNFSAYSPDVPGCVATGRTIEETAKEMKSALEFHFKDEITIPEPKGLNHYMNDNAFKKESTDFILQIQINTQSMNNTLKIINGTSNN